VNNNSIVSYDDLSESLTFIKSVSRPHDMSCQRLAQRWFIVSGASLLAANGPSYETYLKNNDIITGDSRLLSDLNQLSLDLDGRTNMASFTEPSVNAFLTRNTLEQTQQTESHQRILTAFIRRHRDIGYVQGLNLLTALLSCIADEVTTFWLLCSLVNGRTRDFYSRPPVGMRGFVSLCTITSKLVHQVSPLPLLLCHNIWLSLNL
jgi:hypothetical protein